MNKLQLEKPTAIWIDDNKDAELVCHLITSLAKNMFKVVHFQEEDNAIEFILQNKNMVFMVLQDSFRPQGKIITSWKKLRPINTPLIGYDGICGDFSCYVMDAYIPEASQVFAGSFYTHAETKILQAWREKDSRIVFTDRMQLFKINLWIQHFDRWKNTKQNNCLSKENLLIQPVAEELAVVCGVHPNFLNKLTSRQFEELIAVIFKNHGFQVELTARTRDGGYDIFAISSAKIESETLLIEVKHFAPNRPVGVGIVRALYGVKKLQEAKKAILVTSSYVSDDAKREFSRVIPWELELKERSDVIQWCSSYVENILIED